MKYQYQAKPEDRTQFTDGTLVHDTKESQLRSLHLFMESKGYRPVVKPVLKRGQTGYYIKSYENPQVPGEQRISFNRAVKMHNEASSETPTVKSIARLKLQYSRKQQANVVMSDKINYIG